MTPEAREFAEEEGIKIFTADIIYHLFDSFTDYVKQCREERKGEQGRLAVFPCIVEVSSICRVYLIADGQGRSV